LLLRNSILADSIGGRDAANSNGTVSGDHNLVEASGGLPGGVVTLTNDPALGPLTNNGGFTLTHALLPDSPAIDTGSSAGAPATDQRGRQRVVGGGLDLGAYEVQPVSSFNDGIPDWWRQWYFGNAAVTNHLSCATCDATGTGQNNLFKYLAGLDPTNPASVFVLRAEPAGGQPNHQDLQFSPWASGRFYTPWFTTNPAGGSWTPLAGYLGPITNGAQATITDTHAIEPRKYYRLQITLP
jgi:hypothetical protein